MAPWYEGIPSHAQCQWQNATLDSDQPQYLETKQPCHMYRLSAHFMNLPDICHIYKYLLIFITDKVICVTVVINEK